MTKKMVRKYLKIYPSLEECVKSGKTELIVIKNGRKRRVELISDAYKIVEYMDLIIKSEGNFVYDILIKSIIKGIPNKVVISRKPISDAAFYRMKKKLVNKIYELYILDGFVAQEEILSVPIEDER